jgi:hypothetical protein
MEMPKMGRKSSSGRRYSEGGPRPDKTSIKQTEAAERLVAWRGLNPEQQLAALDARLGVGVGAARQRAHLKGLIEEMRPAVIVKPKNRAR